MTISCFTDGRNKMYISRWMTRGFVLVIAAVLVPTITQPLMNPDNLWSIALIIFASLILLVLAWGQLQNAYYLHDVYQLLLKVVGSNGSCKIEVDHNATACVVGVQNRYRIEVTENDSLDVVVFTITGSMILVTKKTPAGVLASFPGEQSSDITKMTFDEEPFSPAYRVQMLRLLLALESELPSNGGCFTP
jgi:hypothetical protein